MSPTAPTPPLDFGHQRMEVVNRLAAGVAHEFNNVLQIVRGYVSFAQSGLPEGCEARDDLEKALIATDRAADLSRRLLQFARADEDESGVGDANDAVDALRLLLRPIIGENIRLCCKTEPNLPPVLGGDAALRQALLNLCVNARDAMPLGGDLTIQTSLVDAPDDPAVVVGALEARSYVVVTIEDTGQGIDRATLGHIFEPFFTTKPVGKGTGLGLPMVAAYVRGAQGAIAVDSRPAHGTRFRLYLSPAPASLPTAEDPPPNPGGG